MTHQERLVRLVRFKTLDELLDTGWEYDSRGDLTYGDEDSFVIKPMFHLFGKILKIERDYLKWTYKDLEEKNDWTICEQMITKELDPKDYPEYMI